MIEYKAEYVIPSELVRAAWEWTQSYTSSHMPEEFAGYDEIAAALGRELTPREREWLRESVEMTGPSANVSFTGRICAEEGLREVAGEGTGGWAPDPASQAKRREWEEERERHSTAFDAMVANL